MPRLEVFNRNQVIQNAMSVFHRKGYNGTSMQDLVDATGLNRSSIYNSFNNKMELFLNCLSMYNDDYKKRTSNAFEQSKSAFDKIEAIFNLYVDDISGDYEQKGCLIANCKSEMGNQNSNISNFLINHQKQTLQFLQGLITEGQSEKMINKKKSAEEYALYIFSALQGLRMTGIFINSQHELKSIVHSTLQVIK